jgi:hypothetical protein
MLRCNYESGQIQFSLDTNSFIIKFIHCWGMQIKRISRQLSIRTIKYITVLIGYTALNFDTIKNPALK